jgi:hypothetical protein
MSTQKSGHDARMKQRGEEASILKRGVLGGIGK